MGGLKTLELILVVIRVISCSSVEEDVFCPDHTQLIHHENNTYRACEPSFCVPRDPDVSQSKLICPNRNQSWKFVDKLLSPSCHWVRLHRGYDFKFNVGDAGSIYELRTNVSHELGDYVYHPQLQEAFICRDKLLQGDDTGNITLWCSAHTIYMAEHPDLHIDERGHYRLHLPHLNLTVLPGLYEIYLKPHGYKVSVCLQTNLEFMRCESKLTLKHSGIEFELLSNLSLLVNWTKPIAYPVGHYYLSADNVSAIVCVKPDNTSQLFHNNTRMYTLYSVFAVFLLFAVGVIVYLFYPPGPHLQPS